jgi:hypothetical protein
MYAGVGAVCVLASATGAHAQPTVATASVEPASQHHARLAYPTTISRSDTADLRAYASRHYIVYTDLDRAEAVPFGRHMDAVYQEYARRFSGFGFDDSSKPADASPMSLYLFRTRDSYLRFLESQGIHAQHSGGMFFVNPVRQGLATWTEGHALRDTLATLQHEGFHQFAWARLSRDLPTWLNEGLAQYFEDAPLVNGKLVTGTLDGTRLLRIQQALNHQRAMPMEQLLTLEANHWGDALHKDLTHSGLLYAQSWSVVYFLIHGDSGRYRSSFVEYLHDLSLGRDSMQSFTARFGEDAVGAMQHHWRRQILALSPTPLDQAEDRLEFFAAAVQLYDQRGWPMPDSIDTMRDQLRSIEFAVVHKEDDITRTFASSDESMFAWRDPAGQSGAFTFIASARPDLPPSITAPGLSPQPVVQWSRDHDGTLRHELTYR